MIELQADARVITAKNRFHSKPRLERTFPRLDLRFIKNLPAKKTPATNSDEIPFDQWTMPAQPQGYIKSRQHDFL